MAEPRKDGAFETLKHAAGARNAEIEDPRNGALTPRDLEMQRNRETATHAANVLVEKFDDRFGETLKTLATSQDPVKCAGAMLKLGHEVAGLASAPGLAGAAGEIALDHVERQLERLQTEPRFEEKFSKQYSGAIAHDLREIREDIHALREDLKGNILSRTAGAAWQAHNLKGHLGELHEHLEGAMHQYGFAPGTFANATVALDGGPLAGLQPGQQVRMGVNGPVAPALGQQQDRGRA